MKGMGTSNQVFLTIVQEDAPPTSVSTTFVCYESVADWLDAMDSARFWIEGVLLTVVGIAGLLGDATKFPPLFSNSTLSSCQCSSVQF